MVNKMSATFILTRVLFMKDKMRKTGFLIVSFFLVVFIGIALCEIILRTTPYKIKDYWQPYNGINMEPVINVPDSVIGWRPKPGQYKVPNLGDPRYVFSYTLWPDGSRATAPVPNKSDRKIILLGCSLTQGWGIDDNKTFAWKLQENYPHAEIINLGVVGYSTYQSLLFLEEYLNKSHIKPAIVIYGFIGHHAERDVADINWLLSISHQAHRLTVRLPYCSLDEHHQLLFFSPKAYPRWFMDRTSFLVNLIKEAYLKWKNTACLKQKKDVARELILRMNKICQQQGAQLIVVNLQAGPFEKDYRGFLERSGIKSADCFSAKMNSPEFKIPIDGHPNAKANLLYAQCIEKILGQQE